MPLKWRRGVLVINNEQLHSARPKLRFGAGSKPVHSVSEIGGNRDL